ncbi:MAG: hypothetical protein ACP5TL_02550 [Candidatus Micrarchaeia archaeon]
MQIQKQTTSQFQIDKSLKAEIKTSLRIIPIKSIIYMLSYARIHSRGIRSKGHAVSLYSNKISAELKFHKKVIKLIKNGKPISDELLYRSISSAIYSYVGFFYSMNDKELSEYLESFDSKKSINLLALPAQHARSRKPIDKTISNISDYVYAVPLLASQNTVNTILSILQFESNTAIKGIPDTLAEKVVALSDSIGNRLNSIKKYPFTSNDIESMQDQISDVFSSLSSFDPNIKEIISEMIGTESANTAKLFRIVRKKV